MAVWFLFLQLHFIILKKISILTVNLFQAVEEQLLIHRRSIEQHLTKFKSVKNRDDIRNNTILNKFKIQKRLWRIMTDLELILYLKKTDKLQGLLRLDPPAMSSFPYVQALFTIVFVVFSKNSLNVNKASILVFSLYILKGLYA